jgi:Ca2+-binding EF-hand superfamily protein
MRLQDFFNLVDEDRSGRLTPDELMQVHQRSDVIANLAHT